jgi:hypothetical protein
MAQVVDEGYLRCLPIQNRIRVYTLFSVATYKKPHCEATATQYESEHVTGPTLLVRVAKPFWLLRQTAASLRATNFQHIFAMQFTR